MASSFTHLHVHTEYSMLDGAARVTDLVAAAVQDGQPALGITDHGNMYGVLDFYRAANDAGITPIIGSEAYMAHDTRFERPSRRGRLDDSGGDTEGGAYAEIHADVLRRFGRFPHRNRALGRSTTEEERAFLDAGGGGFGG